MGSYPQLLGHHNCFTNAYLLDTTNPMICKVASFCEFKMKIMTDAI